MKTCTKCGTAKPFSEFGKASNTRDGLYPSCKDCRSIVIARWQRENPGKANAKSAKWRIAHPEIRRTYHQNRRARKRASGGVISPDLAERLFKLQRGKCACCKQPLGNDYHLDHIMPLALGGTNTDDNIQLLRAKCNLQKSAKHPIDYMRENGFLC